MEKTVRDIGILNSNLFSDQFFFKCAPPPFFASSVVTTPMAATPMENALKAASPVASTPLIPAPQ
jgi:hypothetical protein